MQYDHWRTIIRILRVNLSKYREKNMTGIYHFNSTSNSMNKTQKEMRTVN